MSFTPARVPAALGMGPRTSGPALRSRRAWGAWGGAFWADSKIRSSLLPNPQIGRDSLQREEVGLLRRRLEREGNRHVKQVSAHICSRTLPAVARGFALPPRAASYRPAQETRDQHKHKDNEGGQGGKTRCTTTAKRTAGTTSTTTGSRSRKSTARHRHEHEPEHKRQPAAHACRYCAPLPARKKLLRSTAASALSYSAVAPALASEVAQQHCHFLLPYSL